MRQQQGRVDLAPPRDQPPSRTRSRSGLTEARGGVDPRLCASASVSEAADQTGPTGPGSGPQLSFLETKKGGGSLNAENRTGNVGEKRFVRKDYAMHTDHDTNGAFHTF